MKKHEVLKDKRLFNYIIQHSYFFKNKVFIIYKEKNDLAKKRFGIAVGKKIGNAVLRNKIKRQIRMILNEQKNLFQNNTDYIIMVKSTIKTINFQQMNYSLKELLLKERK